MRRIVLAATIAACSFAFAACSMCDTSSAPTSGVIEENAVTVTATVADVDYDTRMVTLTTSDGETVTFHAGPEVKNLAQLDKGDTIRAIYVESVVYEVKKPGEAAPGVQMAEDAARAEEGDKPGAGAARAVKVTATVAEIDMNAPSVTLRAPNGALRTLPVRDVNRLKAVKVGDLVEFTYTEAIAIGVEELED